MNVLWQDLRYCLRTTRRDPAFSLLVAFTLALAMGANVTVFNFLDLLKWKEIPAREPSRLAGLWTGDRNPALATYDWTSFPDYLYYRDHNQVFSGLLSWMVNLSSLNTGTGPAEWTECWSVTGNYFSLLGVGAAIGRPLGDEDDRSSAARVAVLGYDFWRRRFGADPGAIGRSVRLNGHGFTIVGVAPRGFTGNWAARQADLWVPMKNIDVLRSPEIDWLHGSDLRWLGVIGRLRPGVSAGQAQAAMRVLGDELQALYPEAKRARQTRVVAARMVLPGEAESHLPASRILVCSAAILLLIACANTVILLLLRATRQQGATAIRLALGASRARLLRHLLTQSLLISLLAGAGGLALGVLGSKLVGSYVQAYAHDLRYDARVVVFALLLTAVTPLIFGLAPALAATSPTVVRALREGAAVGVGRPWTAKLRQALVALQIGLALVLGIASGLLGRSLLRLHQVHLGFAPDQVLMVQLNLAQKGYPPAAGGRLFQELLDRLARRPEVVAASLVRLPPLGGITRGVDVEPASGQGGPVAINYNVVGPGFFAALGIPLVAGRALDRRDTAEAPGAIVINQALADQLWPRADPVGKRVTIAKLKRQPLGAGFEVVGVAADSQYASISDHRPEPLFYTSFHQTFQSTMQLAVRTRGQPSTILDQLRRELAGLDPDLALGDVRTLAAQVEHSIWEQRMYAQVSAIFAALGLAVAMLGIFAVMSFAIGLRRREFGLRMALGARRAQILGLVLRQGAALAAAGLGLGLLAAAWAMRLISRFLFGVSNFDPWIFSLAPLALLAVALLACSLPARQASTVEPAAALRHS